MAKSKPKIKVDAVAFANGERYEPSSVKLIKPQVPFNWELEHHGRNIHVMSCKAPSVPAFEQWILLLSDVHIDNPGCHKPTLTRLLKQAVARKAAIFSNGDFLDLMQGFGDPRANKAALKVFRSALLSEHYFDSVVDSTADYLCSSECDYAGTNFICLGEGNHESGFQKRREIDVNGHLARAIKSRCVSSVAAGGYHGYLRVKVQVGTSGFQNLIFTMKHHHGSGGGGLSGGTLDARRVFTYVNADLAVMGHNHASNTVGLATEILTSTNGQYQIKNRFVEFVRIGTLKDEWHSSGWAVERGAGTGPAPICQKWVRLFVDYEYEDKQKDEDGNTTRLRRSHPRINWEVTDAR